MATPDFISKIDTALERASRAHFIGIGGISMSSLAMITKSNGIDVSGSDRTPSHITEKLEAYGIRVFYTHSPDNVMDASIVVYTAAIKDDNPELIEARRLGIPTFARSEYLGWLMRKYPRRIGVAGSHGKSTVTSMISSIFMDSSDPTVVCGAETKELNGTYRLGKDDNFIFEACEYCDSFLSFFPTLAVITNVEYDHPDYFSTMDMLRDSFGKYVRIADSAVFNADDAESMNIAAVYPKKYVTFGFGENADYSARDIENEDLSCSFDLYCRKERLGRISLLIPGRYNVMNALAACAASMESGVSFENCKSGLEKFRGVKRRFEYLGASKAGAAVYCDYAHHPTELRSVISAAKNAISASGSAKRLVCLFQPHTYSRTASLFNDFSDAMSLADVALISDIYAARETNTYGVTSPMLASSIKCGVYTGGIEESAKYINANFGRDDIILILGAGDIISAAKYIV